MFDIYSARIIGNNLLEVVKEVMQGCGLYEQIEPGMKVALKPNLTFPTPKAGVTTSFEFVACVVELLAERGAIVFLVESDGGYGAWSAAEAFAGHDYQSIVSRFGVTLVNLSESPRGSIRVCRRREEVVIPLPALLLDEVDLFITLPVPKIHAMTTLTLSLKNQWGCIPDNMRLRKHYLFNEAINEINLRLRPWVLVDGRFFLDEYGPMDGTPVEMNLVIGSRSPWVCDKFLAELMGHEWRSIGYLRTAEKRGLLSRNDKEVSMNLTPGDLGIRKFVLKRSVRSWIALAGFKSQWLTWFGYESWIGEKILHPILYFFVGHPTK